MSRPLHAGRELACRLEQSASAAAREMVSAHRQLFPSSEAEAMEAGGGVAVFLDEQSPMTHVRGMGMQGPVSESEIDALEQFFDDRQAPLVVSVSPFADETLWTSLTRRGYEFGRFDSVLVRPVEAVDAEGVSEAERADDAAEWAKLLATCFFGEATPVGTQMAATLHALPGCQNLVFRAEGEPAGGAQLDIRDGLATFQCDGTLPPYRGQGIQSWLIRTRLAAAARAGCDLATADAAPGSTSQRNYERQGFQVAYTRMTLLKPCF